MYRAEENIFFLNTMAGVVLQETFSAIGDPATAMRDPMFYRLHSFVDDMFQEHKSTLPRYETNKVSYGGPATVHDPCSGTWSLVQESGSFQEHSTVRHQPAFFPLIHIPVHF